MIDYARIWRVRLKILVSKNGVYGCPDASGSCEVVALYKEIAT